MDFAVLAIGIVLGVGCGAAIAWALRRKSMAAGIGAIGVSFLAISGAIVAVRVLAGDAVVPFGVIAVLSFLAVAVAACVNMFFKK